MENIERIDKIIKDWGMVITVVDGEEKINGRPTCQADMDENWEWIKANKPAFIDRIKERASNLKNLKENEGLNELEEAINAWENYHTTRENRWEDEALSSILPAKPKADIKKLKEKYPKAAAYLKAESYRYASHHAKSAAGRRAMERILAGEDYKTVLAEMEAEWDAYCNAHVWD